MLYNHAERTRICPKHYIPLNNGHCSRCHDEAVKELALQHIQTDEYREVTIEVNGKEVIFNQIVKKPTNLRGI